MPLFLGLDSKEISPSKSMVDEEEFRREFALDVAADLNPVASDMGLSKSPNASFRFLNVLDDMALCCI